MDELLRKNTGEETLECSNCSDKIKPGDSIPGFQAERMLMDRGRLICRL